MTAALAAALALPSAASACRVAERQTPILHETLPELSADVVAAEVEVVTDVRSPPYSHAMDVRVIAMIQGDYAGTTITVEPEVISGCDGWPYPGTRGIIVGRVLSRSQEALVVDPIRAPSAREMGHSDVSPIGRPADRPE